MIIDLGELGLYFRFIMGNGQISSVDNYSYKFCTVLLVYFRLHSAIFHNREKFLCHFSQHFLPWKMKDLCTSRRTSCNCC